jgi:hypothetical protein
MHAVSGIGIELVRAGIQFTCDMLSTRIIGSAGRDWLSFRRLECCVERGWD